MPFSFFSTMNSVNSIPSVARNISFKLRLTFANLKEMITITIDIQDTDLGYFVKFHREKLRIIPIFGEKIILLK
jgi:hypothetical protein